MVVEAIFFYIFAFFAVFASLMVISVKNSVHAVLWLIFTFFNAAGLFLLTGAEFLAMLLVVVYVGAVAVLFLFVIMMLDINLNRVREGFVKMLPVGIIVAGIFLYDLTKIVAKSLNKVTVIPRSDYMIPENLTNTHAIGKVLYTDFMLHFQTAGLILLVAMIGCIVMTLRGSKNAKKQDAIMQQSRTKENSIRLVKLGKGEDLDV